MKTSLGSNQVEIGTDKGLKLIEHWFAIGGLVALARGDKRAARGLLKSAAFHSQAVCRLLDEILTAGRITQAGGRTTQDGGAFGPETRMGESR